jgi:hypothetical protein
LGRATGAALMKEPKLVAARCVERMSYSVDAVSSRVAISVKHGLGVHSMMASYINVQDDRQQGDERHEFCRIVSLGGTISKFHVHTRLGLLEDAAEQSTTLWVPSGDSEAANKQVQETTPSEKKRSTTRGLNMPPSVGLGKSQN